MAKPVRRANGRWQVKIRRAGYPRMSRTFEHRDDALKWQRKIESKLDEGVDVGRMSDLRRVTLQEMVQRWIEEELPGRTSARYERPEAEVLAENAISSKALAYIDRSDGHRLMKELRDYHQPSGKPYSPNTIRRKWSVYLSIVRWIREEAGYLHWPSPLHGVALPPPGDHRERRWEPEDLKAVVAAWRIKKKKRIVQPDGTSIWEPLPPKARGGCRNRYVPLVFRFALETGCRRSEALKIKVADVRLAERRVWLVGDTTKNRRGRWVLLTARAANLIERALRMRREEDEKRVFPISVSAFKSAWQRMATRARLVERNVRMHDSRHEAISRAVDAGLAVPQIVALSGHRDLRSLRVYMQPDHMAVVEALDARAARGLAKR